MAQVIINTANFDREVAGFMKRLTNYRVPLTLFGAYMLRSVTKNFEAQGRPDKWQALKMATIIARFKRGNRERTNKRKLFKMVSGGQAGGAFESAVNSAAGGTIVGAGRGRTFTQGAARAISNAKILMDRGTLRASVVFEVSNLVLRIGSNLKYAATHLFGDADRGIPARPYILIQTEDRAEFNRLFTAHLRGEL